MMWKDKKPLTIEDAAKMAQVPESQIEEWLGSGQLLAKNNCSLPNQKPLWTIEAEVLYDWLGVIEMNASLARHLLEDKWDAGD